MNKFCIGDRVVNTVGFDPVEGVVLPVGIEGTVIAIPVIGVYDVMWDAPINTSWCQVEEELALVKKS